MPFCTECGTKLAETSKFCTECGARTAFGQSVATQSTGAAQAAPAASSHASGTAASNRPGGYQKATFVAQSEEERLRKEEERLTYSVQHSSAKAVRRDPPAATATEPADEHWYVKVVGLPTEAGKPVTLSINGKEAFRSKDDGRDVTAHVVARRQAGANDFDLTVAAMDFEMHQQYKASDGNYLRFAFTEQGLSITQQSKPFHEA